MGQSRGHERIRIAEHVKGPVAHESVPGSAHQDVILRREVDAKLADHLCQERVYNADARVSIKSEIDPILTLFRRCPLRQAEVYPKLTLSLSVLDIIRILW